MAVANYRSALDTDLPANVRAVVERQFGEVKQTHDAVSSLEKSSGAGSVRTVSGKRVSSKQ